MNQVAFEEFGPSEMAEWLERSRATYIAERITAGSTPAEAAESADQTMARTFPGGRPRPGQTVGRIVFAGEQVGELWIGPFADDVERWWVWDIVIDHDKRGRGYGRQAMLMAEELAAGHGAKSLGLNVFAHNTVARGLYRSLGYEESSIQMHKPLT